MTNSVYGQVVGVRKFSNGDIEIDFYHEDEVSTYRYSSDPSRLGNFPKNLIEPLCSVLATDICVEIFFDDSGIPATPTASIATSAVIAKSPDFFVFIENGILKNYLKDFTTLCPNLF